MATAARGWCWLPCAPRASTATQATSAMTSSVASATCATQGTSARESRRCTSMAPRVAIRATWSCTVGACAPRGTTAPLARGSQPLAGVGRSTRPPAPRITLLVWSALSTTSTTARGRPRASRAAAAPSRRRTGLNAFARPTSACSRPRTARAGASLATLSTTQPGRRRRTAMWTACPIVRSRPCLAAAQPTCAGRTAPAPRAAATRPARLRRATATPARNWTTATAPARRSKIRRLKSCRWTRRLGRRSSARVCVRATARTRDARTRTRCP
mmetsp:Transcript_4723/g.14419  ORF Transcript_4723/g.14419 Transcript_4723/m.14419 type:complete len:272 (+) Transcript_4723:4537-5352(+)